MPTSVRNILSYEETYGLVSNYINDDEFDYDVDDEDIKRMIVIMLGLLQEFYIKHQYDSAFIITTEYFENEIKKFNESLKENLMTLFKDYVETVSNQLNVDYSIPAGVVDVGFDLDEIVECGVDNIVLGLQLDLKHKAAYYKNLSIVTGDFSNHADFRRAIKKLTNLTVYNAQTIQKRVDRTYLEFVYGQEALATWNVSGRNTCEWCYMLADLGARPLSEWPVDHPHGGCWLTIVNPDQFSDEYLQVKIEE